LKLAITFSHAFAGNRIVYLAARNATQESDWQPMAVVSVP
jgi:hypothetical protein